MATPASLRHHVAPDAGEELKMRTRLTAGVLCAGLLFAGPGGARQDFSDVEIRTHKVADGVYYLEGAGGNIGLSVGQDGVVMIDDQFAPLTERIVAAIRALDAGEIRFVINTHLHGDHTGGNENLGRMGVLILARDEVRVRLEGDVPDAALPVLTFNETITIHLNGDEVHAFALPPGHTDGDSYVHFRRADVVHAGDVFRAVGFPYVDTGNGGTVAGTIEALGILIELAGAETKIIPGHGGLSTRDDVIAYRDMIVDIVATARPLVARGLSLEEFLEADPAARYRKDNGDPQRFLEAVYAELAERGDPGDGA
jgi:glyoxylase-like metal-dependent hydrolase (beta-lactamase superfamily II)